MPFRYWPSQLSKEMTLCNVNHSREKNLYRKINEQEALTGIFSKMVAYVTGHVIVSTIFEIDERDGF